MTAHEFVDKTAASEAEWRKRIAPFGELPAGTWRDRDGSYSSAQEMTDHVTDPINREGM